jgi:hypothetical protein
MQPLICLFEAQVNPGLFFIGGRRTEGPAGSYDLNSRKNFWSQTAFAGGRTAMQARKRRPGSRRERGNIAVEVAIVTPLLLLIVAGIIDVGMLYWEKSVMTNAIREGARAAARATVGGTAEFTASQVMTNVVKPYLDRYNLRDASGSLISLTLGGNFTYTVNSTVTPKQLTLALNGISVRMMLLPNIETLFGGEGYSSTVYLNAQITMAAEW